jgi:hypothetical protein
VIHPQDVTKKQLLAAIKLDLLMLVMEQGQFNCLAVLLVTLQ